jgi:hypothetical protein
MLLMCLVANTFSTDLMCGARRGDIALKTLPDRESLGAIKVLKIQRGAL